MPGWVLRGLGLLSASGGDTLQRAIALAAAVLVLFIGVVLAVPFGILRWGTPVPLLTGRLPPGSLGQWMRLVLHDDPGGTSVPAALVLAFMRYESGGDWQASRLNADGTEDAGLMQVNSRHWAAFGLSRDPLEPSANVAAGLALLREAAGTCYSTLTLFGQVMTSQQAALAAEELSCTLETYNGWGNGYAQAVLAGVPSITEGAHVTVRPLGALGDGTVAAVPQAGAVTFVVTAYAPWGYPPEVWDGVAWPGIELPVHITAADSLTGRPVALAPCSAAPRAVARWLPPGAGCWYATQRPEAGSTAARLAVTATFIQTRKETGPHGRTVLKEVRVPVTGEARAIPGPPLVAPS